MSSPSTRGALPLGEWQRLHPLSPLLRGGIALLAFASFLIAQVWDGLMSALGVPGFGVPDDLPGAAPGVGRTIQLGWLALVGAGLAVVAVIILVAWLSWRFTRFRVADGQIEQRVGWVMRQHRQVPLARVQAVEISRPLLARLVGLSQVVVQSAGSGDSHLTLAFLAQGRGSEIRDELLRLAGISDEGGAGLPAGDGPPADLAAPLVTVPNGRLFVATILHGSVILIGGAALVALIVAGATRVGPWALLSTPALIPIALGVAISRVKELLTHGNFVVTDLGRSLRMHHGLTDLKTTMVPLHRIQAVEVVQPLWWRWFGWWRVRINVAGAKVTDMDELLETVALPVAPFEDVLRIMSVLDPRLHPDALDAAAVGSGPDQHWRGVPRRARWLDPWGWRRIGYAVTPGSLLLRKGFFTRSAIVLPHARIQSSRLSQGPVQRRLGIASVTFLSTPGPVSPTVPHLDVEEAELLLADESSRAGTARAAVPADAAPPRDLPGDLPEWVAPGTPNSVD